MALPLRRVHLRALPVASLRPSLTLPARNVPACYSVNGRLYSTPAAGQRWRTAFRRIPNLFTVLLAVGVGTTGFGLYEYFNSFTMWPPELRADLRAGLKAKNQGDLDLSARFMHRAYETSLTLPASVYGAEPHLKLSGIAVAYAEILEALSRPREAYEVYLDALQRLRHAAQPDPSTPAPNFQPFPAPTHRERMRAVALASRLGAMAEEWSLPLADEEAYLTYAVEEMLRVMRDVGGEPGGLAAALFGSLTKREDVQDDAAVVLSSLSLPAWVSTADVGAPLENLGNFYSRTGRYDYAMQLYLQATSFLIPPAPKSAPAENRCRGAQIMLSLADVIIKASAKNEQATVHQAHMWAQKSLVVVTQARGAGSDVPPLATPAQDADGAPHVCEVALVAALFNLGVIAELESQPEEAKKLYTRSATQATRVRMSENATEAKAAARRVERAQRVQGAGVAPEKGGGA